MSLFWRWTTKKYREDGTAIDAGEATVRISRNGSQADVVVAGRVTVDSSPYVRSALFELLRRGETMVLVIDLSGVSYLDISGIATVVEALKSARERSVMLRLTGVKGQARVLAEVMELSEVFRRSGSEVELQ
ncbi:MAG: STAS domain-containing protein [Acidobacteriota bacterium]